MAPKKAAAAVAASLSHAAKARHKGAAQLDVGAAHKERLRAALEELGLDDDDDDGAPPPGWEPPARAAAVERVAAAADELAAHGFSHAHVEAALGALPLHVAAAPAPGAAAAAAMDWLLLRLEPAELPPRFAAQAEFGPGGPVELRLAFEPPSGEDRAARRAEDAAAAAAAAAAAREAEAAARRRAEAAAAAAAAEQADAQRAWILERYAASDSGGGSGSEGGGSGSEPEDWELYNGDVGAAEAERRRAARLRERLPREARVAAVAADWRAAAADATAAKAAGDKAAARACGARIGQLKREMAELGITEGDLPPPQPAAAAAPEPAAEPAAEPAPGPAIEPPGRESTDGGGSSSSDEAPDFDLFDGDASLLETAPGQAKKKRRPADPGAAAAAAGNKKRGSKPVAPPPPVLQPKAVLQQACAREGLPPPRYERLPHGGERLAAGGVRYAVAVALGARGAGAAARAPRRPGAPPAAPRTISLREAEDGWERIEEAQAAAAARALFEMYACGAGQALAAAAGVEGLLPGRLPPAIQELWAEWEDERDAAGGGGRADEAAAARRALAERVVDAKLAAAAAEPGRRAGGRDAGGAGAGDARPWEERLAAALGGAARRAAGAAEAEAAEGARARAALAAFRASAEGRDWAARRAALPVAAVRAELLAALAERDAVVLCGETGSGKTTQAPQYVLEDAAERGAVASVVCTQPRRVAATSVAARVADERGEPPPGAPGAAVGHHVRLDAAVTAGTRLLFCTTGILLRRLARDPALAGVTHVFVDEVHERTLEGDFLMALLRGLAPARRAAGRPLKVVLMSATVDAELYSGYFGGCPVLRAEGRTFPVELKFLEDAYEETGYLLDPDGPCCCRGGARADEAARARRALGRGAAAAAIAAGWGDAEADGLAPRALNPNFDPGFYAAAGVRLSERAERNLARLDEERLDLDLLEALVAHLDGPAGGLPPGALLVFLPGAGEIRALADRLLSSAAFRGAAGARLVQLHSGAPPAEARRAFAPAPRGGGRKVVLATNIAETSVTIEDVVAVVDSGRLKERRHDPGRGLTALVEDWVSLASAAQRRGRAGRVRPGVCYAAFTRERFERRLRRHQVPEMQRVPLEALVLQIKLLGLGAAAPFLARVLQPPPARAVDGALRALRDVGALAPDGEALTPLGVHLAALPVDARLGKLLLLSATLGCLAPGLSIAACLAGKSPFAAPPTPAGDADLARARAALAAPSGPGLAAGQQSDHLLLADAVGLWLAARAGAGGRRAGAEFARAHCLSEPALEAAADLRRQFALLLADIGFVRRPGRGGGGGEGGDRGGGRGAGADWADDPALPANRHARHAPLVRAALLGALHPNLAVMDAPPPGGVPAGRPGWHDGAGAAALHPSSLLAGLPAHALRHPYVTYLEKVRTSRVFLRDCTVASPAAILLFGASLEVAHAAGAATVDGWLRLRVPAAAAVLVARLRRALEALLAAAAADPGAAAGAGAGRAAAALAALLDAEEAAAAARARAERGWEY